jgi:V-type H+-transporting ATPase subunit A
VIKDEFLQQNSFSEHDYNCPLYKTLGMMKAIVLFYEGCIRVIVDTAKRSEQKMSMAQIEMYLSRQENGNVMDRINSMKFFDPAMAQDSMKR